MLRRIYDSKIHNWKSYGGRGVSICLEWHCFENFLSDIKKLPGYNLDKIISGSLVLDKDIRTNTKLYSKDTCSWVSKAENGAARDTSTYRSHLVLYKDGLLVSDDIGFAAAAKACGVTTQVLGTALKKGTEYKGILVKKRPL